MFDAPLLTCLRAAAECRYFHYAADSCFDCMIIRRFSPFIAALTPVMLPRLRAYHASAMPILRADIR